MQEGGQPLHETEDGDGQDRPEVEDEPEHDTSVPVGHLLTSRVTIISRQAISSLAKHSLVNYQLRFFIS